MRTGPRVVVVTGASSGIGRAAALRVAAEGDHLVLAARGAGPLREVADRCRQLGAASARFVPTDVGDDTAVERLFTQVLADHGRVDAVLHCAGVVAYGRTEEVPREVFDGVLRTNVAGSVSISRHALAPLRETRGTLVLVGSVIGHIGVPGMSPYVVSKWAVRALARQLQLENRGSGVRVAYLAPGGVDTPVYRQGATYAGFVGRPPPPVDDPDRVARTMVRLTRHPRNRTQLGLANGVMRFGFSALPWAFDLLVGPLFAVTAQDRTQTSPPTPGNVLASRPDGNDVRGHQGSPVAGVARNLAVLASSLLERRPQRRPATRVGSNHPRPEEQHVRRQSRA